MAILIPTVLTNHRQASCVSTTRAVCPQEVGPTFLFTQRGRWSSSPKDVPIPGILYMYAIHVLVVMVGSDLGDYILLVQMLWISPKNAKFYIC